MTQRTIKLASADVGQIFTACNLRGFLNIIGIDALRCFLVSFFVFLLPFGLHWSYFGARKETTPKIGLKIGLLYNGSICYFCRVKNEGNENLRGF
jgi:hypothetical protein